MHRVVRLYRVKDEFLWLLILFDGLQVVLYNQTEVLRAVSRMLGGGLELTFLRMDGDLATGEVEVMMVVTITVLHAQCSDVEIKASLQVCVVTTKWSIFLILIMMLFRQFSSMYIAQADKRTAMTVFVCFGYRL